MDALKLLLAFSPWIAFWIISGGHSMVRLQIGICVAAVLVLVHGNYETSPWTHPVGRCELLCLRSRHSGIAREPVGDPTPRSIRKRHALHGYSGFDCDR